MLRVFVFVCLSWPLCSAFSSLPAPIKTSMDSVDLHHVLRWVPGPQTPKGTQYKVLSKYKRKWKVLGKTSMTFLKVELDIYQRYNFTVQAVYNQTSSTKSSHYTFRPLEETRISPAQVLLSGCGKCLIVNISLAEPSLYRLYDPAFSVHWKTPGGTKYHIEIRDRSFNISNLEKGVEYCVQVETKIRVNSNTEPSAWTCSFTSIQEPRTTVPVFLGAAAALLVVLVAVVMSIVIGLRYSGFLCKLKNNLPRALQEALSGGYTLTPETTIPDQVSISSEKHTRLHNPPKPPSAAGGANPTEEEEEEEEGEKEYLDRGAELPSSDRSCPHSTSGNSGSSAPERERMVTERGLDQDEDEEEEVSVPPVKSQTGPQGHQTGQEEEEEEEEVCDSSGNINLFSVTLSALPPSEEKQEEEEEEKQEEEEEEKVEENVEENEDKQELLDVSCTHTNTTVTRLTETDSSCEEEEEEFSGYMRHS